MFRIKIVCVGTIKEKFFKEAFDEYAKRCQKFFKLEVVEVKEGEPSKRQNQKIEEEGKRLETHFKGKTIGLDEKGELFSSMEFSKFIEESAGNGNSQMTFVIGGSHGLMPQTKAKCDKLLSFGKITFPHQLARVVLIEQIYRAFTIIKKTAYHK